MQGGTAPAVRRPTADLGRRVPRTNRADTAVDMLVAAAVVLAGANLLAWRFGQLGRIGAAGWALVAVEAVTVGWMIFTAALVIGRSSPDNLAPDPVASTSLDILIPVAGEPVELVRATIEAARRVEWPHTVIVCNDGRMAGAENWREIELLCFELGVHCLTRLSGPRGKAGNLNNALGHTRGEVVLVIDADHQVVPDVAQQMLGWFGHEEVAFVSSPQTFWGGGTDPLNPTEPVFYKAIQPARDRHGLAFSTGSGVMYRREAIVRIGGFSEWSIVEDLHTSLRLHDAGWSSVFHSRPVSIGVAPATSAEFARQRLRWAVDSLRILRHQPPWRLKGLTTRAKLHYTHTLLSYLVSMVQLAFLLGPAAWIVGRLTVVADGGWQQQLMHIGPWLAALGVALVWWAGPRGAVRSLRLSAAFLPAVFWAASARAFSAGSERGSTTNKGRQPRVNWLLVGASVLPAALFATLLWGAIDHRPGGSDIAMLWAALLFSLAVGPILRFGPGLRWPIVLQVGLVAVAWSVAAGSVATARLAWSAPAGLFASHQIDPATIDLQVEQNDLGGTVVVGPAVVDPDAAPISELAADAMAPTRVSLAPTDGIYVGFTSDALPFDLADADRWASRLAEPQIVHWYQQWGSGESRFRGDWLAQVAADDRVPMVSWEAWAKPDGSFHSAEQDLGQLRRIADGQFDDYIDDWAAAAADYGRPLLLRPFHEMNGFWYPWSVGVNGNTSDDYVDAWHHVVDRFDAADADNVSFVWSVNTLASFEEGRGIEAYYPGDDYVDWVATSGFNWDDYADWASWVPAQQVFGETYQVLEGFGKPVMFAEIGTGHHTGDADAWVADALDWFATLPELRAIVWFDRSYDGGIDFRLSPSQQSAFGSGIARNPAFLPEIGLVDHPVDVEEPAGELAVDETG